MAQKLLVANRGEIACRIIRTCRRLGIGTIAVYSSADRNALHVEMADEAVRIGSAAAGDSYLDGESIIAAARRCGAWAIHPGFGFLSENADFAAACGDHDVVFVGPSTSAIRSMASKSEAKRIMSAAGVPVLAGDPGATGDDDLIRTAHDIGFPVMVKPALGGGGRGMRVVEEPDQLVEALAAARREAFSSFGSDALLIEKYLKAPRHIEIQVFGDDHGNLLHLFERDCSVQRRHQKVVEEAPAPGLGDELRQRLGDVAVKAAKAVDYVGAGTIEFLLDSDGSFAFMEMNTRLQVEHPVTEAITGIDLVDWQLQVANGSRLPKRQEDIEIEGHAIEARLYAEDPAAAFRPGTGRISHLFLPGNHDGVRIDSGVRKGDEITIHYDPMIAKVIAHGANRQVASERLSAALGAVRVAGPLTNEAFLRAIVDHAMFRAGQVDTEFIAGNLSVLTAETTEPVVPIQDLAALALLTSSQRGGRGRSPWADKAGWRLGGAGRRSIVLEWRDDRFEFARYPSGDIRRSDGTVLAGHGRWTSRVRFEGMLEGVPFRAEVVRDRNDLTIFLDDRRYNLMVCDPLSVGSDLAGDASSLRATMPGVVTAVRVRAGDIVAANQPLLVMEAMKVEHTICAPSDGRITEILFAAGERVHEGDQLVGFEAIQASAEE